MFYFFDVLGHVPLVLNCRYVDPSKSHRKLDELAHHLLHLQLGTQYGLCPSRRKFSFGILFLLDSGAEMCLSLAAGDCNNTPAGFFLKFPGFHHGFLSFLRATCSCSLSGSEWPWNGRSTLEAQDALDSFVRLLVSPSTTLTPRVPGHCSHF